MHYETTVNVKGMEAYITVHFEYFPGCKGDSFNPPEPDKFEITDIDIDLLASETWEKTAKELKKSGCYTLIYNYVKNHLDYYDLYDGFRDRFYSEYYETYYDYRI